LSDILSVLWSLKKRGLREVTVKNVNKFLRVLNANVGLNDIEAVKGFIASHSCSEGYKRNLVYAYDCYLDFKGLTWQRPVYREKVKLPKIPAKPSPCPAKYQNSPKQTAAFPKDCDKLRSLKGWFIASWTS
jgi:hypothetical protein